ncbi:MAG TPA: ATP-dependent DNA ligase [Phycisphaerales bacterium]|nr:ATP-dependent DNA ligase [Phycisphaerales bacterium]
MVAARIDPSLPPMEALSVAEIPAGPEWQYEPKWDGFRCLAYREQDQVVLQSKSGRPLARYFPEVVEDLARLPAKRFVLDGELVVPVGSALSFEELQLRLHPAESRVRKLAAAHPAWYVVFDLLQTERGTVLLDAPLAERRRRLEAFAARCFPAAERIALSPATRAHGVARRWFTDRHAGLDGVIAKRLDLAYQAGLRTGMQKIKHLRTADCVVGGFRYATAKRVVGSLLLGLYDQAGLLHHVGFTSALARESRPELTARLEKLRDRAGPRTPAGFSGGAPGGPSRWSTERTGEWEAVPPVLVVEVEYDHFSGGRFRHGTRLLRWRPDKGPSQCTFEQVRPAGSGALAMLDRRDRPEPGLSARPGPGVPP